MFIINISVLSVQCACSQLIPNVGVLLFSSVFSRLLLLLTLSSIEMATADQPMISQFLGYSTNSFYDCAASWPIDNCPLFAL